MRCIKGFLRTYYIYISLIICKGYLSFIKWCVSDFYLSLMLLGLDDFSVTPLYQNNKFRDYKYPLKHPDKLFIFSTLQAFIPQSLKHLPYKTKNKHSYSWNLISFFYLLQSPFKVIDFIIGGFSNSIEKYYFASTMNFTINYAIHELQRREY